MKKYLPFKKMNIGLIIGAFIFFIAVTSCKKNSSIIVSDPTPQPVEASLDDIPKLPIDTVPSDAQIYKVGSGSGDLTVDGSDYNCNVNTFIKIRGGKYNTITLKNFVAAPGLRIFIKNDGEVRILEAMFTLNLSNVTISGDNVKDLTYGFKFENIPYRAISMKGKMNGVTLRNLSFYNVGNYVIAGERSNGADLEYDGTAETRTENFKILNCYFQNAAQINFGGRLNKDTGGDSGFFNGVEIAFNVFENTPNAGNVCTFSNVQDYDIHSNVLNNINSENNNHNGIFHMQGNGKFHHNKLTNYQGNAIRMWLYSRGGQPVTNEIYHNICFNTRKYGGFELQSFESHFVNGKTTFANAKVYNNTVGKMNTSKDWEGQILDLYNIRGSLEYYNNLGFELVTSKGSLTGNMINNMSKTPLINEHDNLYYSEHNNAVNSLADLASKHPGVGAVATN
jgi:hypothetical protein